MAEPVTQKRRSKLLAVNALSLISAVLHHHQETRPTISVAHTVAYHSLDTKLSGMQKDIIIDHFHRSWIYENSLYLPLELFDNDPRTTLSYAAFELWQAAKNSIRYSQYNLLMATGVAAMILDTPPVRAEARRLVVQNYYPRWMSFYASGHYENALLHRLNITGEKNEHRSLLALALVNVRNQRFHEVKDMVQQSEKLAIRSERDGHILTNFCPEHWQQLMWRVGYTTFFDLFEAATLPNELTIASIEQLQRDLQQVVGLINDAHENYLHKLMPRRFLEAIPEHHAFVRARWA